MANNHWSQFSYEPKLFIFNPLLIVITAILLFAAQKWSLLAWLAGGIWVYTLIFQFFFKMPISYTGNLIRKFLTGANKKPKNYRDPLEL